MAVNIRGANADDAGALTALNQTCMGYGYPMEKTAAKLKALLSSSRDRIFVAETEGRVVGYVHLADYDVLYADHMKNIMGIAVDPSCRRQGVGRALLEAGECWAKESGAEGVPLVSGESRVGTHAFYRALGYTGN